MSGSDVNVSGQDLCPHCGLPGYVGDDADIVDQLLYWDWHEGSDLWGKAADEIIRLRALLDDREVGT